VNVNGKLLIPCGLQFEARIQSKDNEKYEIMKVQERSTESNAVLLWPAAYEKETDVDWFIRVLYGEDMKQVYLLLYTKLLFIFVIFVFVDC
jgi:hypothetical protein